MFLNNSRDIALLLAVACVVGVCLSSQEMRWTWSGYLNVSESDKLVDQIDTGSSRVASFKLNLSRVEPHVEHV